MSDRFWIVWNPDSTSPPRYRWTSESSASAESMRLSRECPGQTFHVMEQRSWAKHERPDMTAESFLASTREADGLGPEWKTARVDELNEEVQKRLSALDDVCIEMGELVVNDGRGPSTMRRNKREHGWVRDNIADYVKAYDGGHKFADWLDDKIDTDSDLSDRQKEILRGIQRKLTELTGIFGESQIPF